MDGRTDRQTDRQRDRHVEFTWIGPYFDKKLMIS
jgi:hypothetical protein